MVAATEYKRKPILTLNPLLQRLFLDHDIIFHLLTVLKKFKKILSKVLNTFENIMENGANFQFSIIFSNTRYFQLSVKRHYYGGKLRQVICIWHQLNCLGCLLVKQFRPRSDCSLRSSVIKVQTVCLYTYISQYCQQICAADTLSR